MSKNIQLELPKKKGKEEYLTAGADYVISSITELKELICILNTRQVFRKVLKGNL